MIFVSDFAEDEGEITPEEEVAQLTILKVAALDVAKAEQAYQKALHAYWRLRHLPLHAEIDDGLLTEYEVPDPDEIGSKVKKLVKRLRELLEVEE